MLEGLLPSMKKAEQDDDDEMIVPKVSRISTISGAGGDRYDDDSDDDDLVGASRRKGRPRQNRQKAEEAAAAANAAAAAAATSGGSAAAAVDKEATSHDQIFVFCLMWSLGAFLENEDRRKLEVYMGKHTKLKMPRLPDGDTAFNYNVNVHTGRWFHWNTLISDYVPPEITPLSYSSLLIPNVSSVRTEFLIDVVARNGHAVLLMGEQGSAKTTMINSHMKRYSTETHVLMSTTFSSTTTPQLFQKGVEGNVDKRMGNTYGPPTGKTLLMFIDDVNLPSYNEWGDQVTNELLRQLMEMKGFYSLEKPGDFSNIVDVNYLAAMIQPGKRKVRSGLNRTYVRFGSLVGS